MSLGGIAISRRGGTAFADSGATDGFGFAWWAASKIARRESDRRGAGAGMPAAAGPSLRSRARSAYCVISIGVCAGEIIVDAGSIPAGEPNPVAITVIFTR